jgi:hypothetical protein
VLIRSLVIISKVIITHHYLLPLKLKKESFFFSFFICGCRIRVYESDVYSVGKILGLLFDGWYVSGPGGGIMSKERFERWKKLQKRMTEEVYLFNIRDM